MILCVVSIALLFPVVVVVIEVSKGSCWVLMRRVSAAVSVATVSAVLVGTETQLREMKVKHKKFFSHEGVSHARRVSWAPHTTPKKQGVFAKLSRSNFFDRKMLSPDAEPYNEEMIEAHRVYERPDIYIYKYNVSPTHLSLRP